MHRSRGGCPRAYWSSICLGRPTNKQYCAVCAVDLLASCTEASEWVSLQVLLKALVRFSRDD